MIEIGGSAIAALKYIPLEILGIITFILGVYSVWAYFNQSKPHTKFLIIGAIYFQFGLSVIIFFDYLFSLRRDYIFGFFIFSSILLFVIGLAISFIKGQNARTRFIELLKIWIWYLVVGVIIVSIAFFFL